MVMNCDMKTLMQVKNIANRCTHFGMCKIDFLGTGVCPSGTRSRYVSYYPQGRMEIANALTDGLIQVSRGLIDIARSCTLCGICDRQCYFINELRPMRVMRALKEYVEDYLSRGGHVYESQEDPVLHGLRGIVDREWATNDPAHLIAYSRDTSPYFSRRIPKYVVMPKTSEEVTEIMRIANKHRISFVPRGTGANTLGIALGKGIIIDLNRMDSIHIDTENWSATVGAGVSAFDLQREAYKYGMRANVSEPAACVCSNLVCSGIYSPFSYSYGMAANNYIDAQIVARDGRVFNLQSKRAPNLFAYAFPPPGTKPPSPGICTEARVKLHPVFEDEECIFIPFTDLLGAMETIREMARRRIGIAAGIIGVEYLATFVAPTHEVALQLNEVLKERMGIRFLLMLLGDRYDMENAKSMVDLFIDQEIIRLFMFNVSKLNTDEGLEILSQVPASDSSYQILLKGEMKSLIKMNFSSNPETIAEAIDEDFYDFYKELYSRPQMTDFRWLNMFRILSARMGRNHAFVARIFWCPLDRLPIVLEVCDILRETADKYGLKNEFGFLTPVDSGKRAVLEYDYYFDQNNEQERNRTKKAAIESIKNVGPLVQKTKGLLIGELTAFQGLSRMENFLYV